MVLGRRMEQLKWKLVQCLIACFVVLTPLSMFFYWYHTGTTPLGWDTPKYIYEMRLLVEKGPLNLITLNYAFFLYSLIGGGISLLFNISPYYVEIYFPIVLLLALIFTWYNLSRKWFENGKISTLTFLFTLTCFSTFNFPIFRHANLLGFILALIGVTYVPKFYQGKVSRKYLAGVWGIFLLGSLSHPHTMVLIWGILFLTTLILLAPSEIREKVGIHCKMKHNWMKNAFKRTMLVGGAVFLPVILGILGQGKKLVYKPGFVRNPFPIFFYYRLREVFFDFGGFMIVFFSLGFLVIWRRLKQQQRNLRFKDALLVGWTLVPIFLLILSLFFHPFTVYARRALLLLPAPILEAIGVRRFLAIIKEKLPLTSLSSLGLHQEKTQMGVLLTSLIVIPTIGTEYFIFDRFTPARRYVSEKTVKQLKFIGKQTKKQRKPIFMMVTPDLDEQSIIKAWDGWIKLYVGDFYIYPGTIHNLLYSERPRIPEEVAQWYYRETKQEGMLDHESLEKHQIYVLPEFYRKGDFTATEAARLHEWKKGIHLLNISTSMAITSRRKSVEAFSNGFSTIYTPSSYSYRKMIGLNRSISLNNSLLLDVGGRNNE